MKTRRVALCVPLLIGLLGSASVYAQLFNGNAVEVFQYNPYYGQNVSFGGVVTVGPGIEGFLPSFYTVDVTDTTITVAFSLLSAFGDGGPNPLPTGMNGIRVLDVNNTIPSFTSLSLVSSSVTGFSSSRIAFDANNVYLDFQNLGTAPGQSVTVEVNGVSPIPEPEIYAMMMVGLGVLSFVARRRKLQATVPLMR